MPTDTVQVSTDIYVSEVSPPFSTPDLISCTHTSTLHYIASYPSSLLFGVQRNDGVRFMIQFADIHPRQSWKVATLKSSL